MSIVIMIVTTVIDIYIYRSLSLYIHTYIEQIRQAFRPWVPCVRFLVISDLSVMD